MGKLQSEKKKGKKTAAPTNGVFFLSFYGDVARQPCPISSLPGSEMEGVGTWSVSHG